MRSQVDHLSACDLALALQSPRSRGRSANRRGGPAFEIRIGRIAETSSGVNSSSQQLIARAQMSQSKLHFWPSQTPGSDDRMPEERSEKSNHNNPKDKTPRFENRGGVVARGQLGSGPIKVLAGVRIG